MTGSSQADNPQPRSLCHEQRLGDRGEQRRPQAGLSAGAHTGMRGLAGGHGWVLWAVRGAALCWGLAVSGCHRALRRGQPLWGRLGNIRSNSQVTPNLRGPVTLLEGRAATGGTEPGGRKGPVGTYEDKGTILPRAGRSRAAGADVCSGSEFGTSSVEGAVLGHVPWGRTCPMVGSAALEPPRPPQPHFKGCCALGRSFSWYPMGISHGRPGQEPSGSRGRVLLAQPRHGSLLSCQGTPAFLGTPLGPSSCPSPGFIRICHVPSSCQSILHRPAPQPWSARRSWGSLRGAQVC